MKIWILLPAFNEENSIPRMVPKISAAMEGRKQEYEIVLLDDGSTDETFGVAEEHAKMFPMTVLRHDRNRGLGETERDLFEFVADNAAAHDVAVRFDCDDTHDPKYILDLIDKLAEGHDVVNTSRFQKGGGQLGVEANRGFISLCANVFMRLVFNIKGVRDCSCGFRAYRAVVLKDAVRFFGNSFIQLKGFGFTSTLETIVKLKLMGCSFAEVPFVLRYDKKASESKMVTSTTTIGYMVMALFYHWPWGGWRSAYKGLGDCYRKDPEQALAAFGRTRQKRSTICQIGG